MSDPRSDHASLALASRGHRLMAQLVDASLSLVPVTLLFVGLWPAITGVALVLGGKAPEQTVTKLMHGSHGGRLIAIALAAWAVLTLYQWSLLAREGVTVGKRLMGVRVVAKDGQPAGFSRALALRVWAFGVLCMIPYVGWLVGAVHVVPIFFKSRRCLHDVLAGTVVVHVVTRSPSKAVLVLCAALATAALVAVLGAAFLHAASKARTPLSADTASAGAAASAPD